MKKALLVKIILISLCLILCSCRSSPPYSVLRSSFRCEVSWNYGGEEFRASVSVDEPSDSSRGFFMRMTYPRELSGLWIEQSSAGACLYMNGKVIGEPPRHYISAADSLLSVGSFDYLCSADLGGTKAHCYTSESSRWYFSASDGRPLRVENSEITLDILWIEPS